VRLPQAHSKRRYNGGIVHKAELSQTQTLASCHGLWLCQRGPAKHSELPPAIPGVAWLPHCHLFHVSDQHNEGKCLHDVYVSGTIVKALCTSVH
jgi:hypothetical protein